MSEQSISVVRALVVCTGLALAACGAPPEDGSGTQAEETAQAKQDVLNGATLNPNYSGWAEVLWNNPPPARSMCSANFIRNQFVITAAHCIGPTPLVSGGPDHALTPAEVGIRMGNQTFGVVAMAVAPNDDVALIIVDHPALLTKDLNGPSTTGFKRPFDKRSAAAKANEPFFCEGYGGNNYTNPPLTYAYLKGKDYSSLYPATPFCVLRNDTPVHQIEEHGDSGGGCFQDLVYTLKPLSGVNSWCDDKYDGHFCCEEPASDWAPWVEGWLSYFGAL